MGRAPKESAAIKEAEERRLQRESEKALAAVGYQPHIPTARPPLAAPSGSTLEDEMWRLQRLYGASADFAMEDCDEGGCTLRLTHQCTVPDWEAENWAPHGLKFEIKIPATYPIPDLTSPELRVLVTADLPLRFVQMLPLLFAEALAKAPPGSPAIYRALQHVDRFLSHLWLKVRAITEREHSLQRSNEQALMEERQRHDATTADPEQQARTANQHASMGQEAQSSVLPSKAPQAPAQPWSPEEQALLEAAIVQFKSETDIKRRWNLIAKHIGGSRTARDCAERFRACRDFALGKTHSPDATLVDAQEENASSSATTLAPVSATAWSVDEVRRLGVEVRLIGLTLEGFATMIPHVVRLQVVCSRCKKPLDMQSPEGGIEARTAEAACSTCKQELSVRIAPSICHGGCTTIAHVLGVNCHPTQLLRSDVDATCGECTERIRVRNVGPGYKKRADCNACHIRVNLAIEGAELLGNAVAHWRDVAEQQGERMNARQQLQEARRQEREMGIHAGQPLPSNGQCKHFSKSYRWLRFPCCGRAFPCPVCHDENADHPHEWANRMLCGHCSHEQPFSKDHCVKCGAAQTRSRSAYWEGGEGNRNRVTMAKNDPHKYKGLGKTVSVKK